jgi:outer membrane protein assembly factor BamA
MKLFRALFFLIPVLSFAQTQSGSTPTIVFTDTSVSKIPSSFKDEQSITKYLSAEINRLRSRGYLEASLDSFVKDSTRQIYYLHTGPAYKWAYLRKGNADPKYLSRAGFNAEQYESKKLDPVAFSDFERKLLSLYEDDGYSFTSITLDSIEHDHEGIKASLNVNKYKRLYIDSIRIRSTSRISETYIYNYIGIKQGDVYNESLIRNIDQRLKEIAFIQVTRPTEIIFTPRYTKVLIYAERKRANQFDGLLGFLPDPEGKLLVTGQVHINLNNALNNGDAIEVNWKKLQPLTQDLYARLNYPFLFHSHFGTEVQLHIYKKDTTYIDVRRYGALQYFLTRGNTFKVFAQNKTTSLLSVRGLENATALPQFADVSNILYGIGYKMARLDYRFNPRKGYAFSAEGGAGSRNIRKNSRINPEAYNNVVMKSAQYQATATVETYIPLLKSSTIKLAATGGWLESPTYFTNELYRLGGLRSLRGFDEESIYASSYSVFTAEYRLLIDRNSYMQLFFDQGIYENKLTNISDTPYGFGAGISFETKAGIFSLSYALGKQFDNPLFLRSAKVHFGIVNYF